MPIKFLLISTETIFHTLLDAIMNRHRPFISNWKFGLLIVLINIIYSNIWLWPQIWISNQYDTHEIVLEISPHHPKKWRVDCSATVGRMVVCVVRREGITGLRMFRPLSIDSGSTRAHDKAPRLWVPPSSHQRPVKGPPWELSLNSDDTHWHLPSSL